MSKGLPEGWTLTGLANCAQINPRHPRDLDDRQIVTFVPMPAVSDSSPVIDCRQERPLADVRTGFTHFAEGDVLFAKITPCMENGKGGVARGLRNGLGCGTTELHIVRPEGGICSDYIYYYLQQDRIRREAAANFTGSAGQLRVPVSYIRDLEFPIPPLAEQRRIVQKLEAVLGKVAACRARLARIPAILKRFRQAVLAAACSGRLTADWREDNPHVDATQLRNEIHAIASSRSRSLRAGRNQSDWDTCIEASWTKELPTGWTSIAFHRLLREPLCNGISPPGTETPPGVRSLKLNAMTESGIDFNVVRYLQIDDELAADLAIRPGDFFVSRGNGSLRLVGRGSLASTPSELTVYPDTMIRARFHSFLAETRWIPTIWASLLVRQQIEAKAKTTAGIWKISQGDLASIQIPLPSLNEQNEIVRRVEALFALADALEARLANATAQVEKLTQSVLAKAFRGELVPTEAELASREGRDYEPASALLDRVRSARSVTSAAPKRARRKSAKSS